MRIFQSEINLEQLPGVWNYDPVVQFLVAAFLILVLLLAGGGFVGWRYDKLEKRAEERGKDDRWMKARLRSVIVMTSILFVGASIGIITGFIAMNAPAAAEQKGIDAANVRSREMTQEAIVTSLLDTYQVESVHPLAGETQYSNLEDSQLDSLVDYDGTDANGVWSADWIILSLKNDPLIAPQADVVLADGNIVTWGVIIDGKSGTARFVNRAKGSTISISPADAEKNRTPTPNSGPEASGGE